MKNFEKYEKEILEIAKRGENLALSSFGLTSCGKMFCMNCLFSANQNNGDLDFACGARRMQWLYQEYVEKPKLNSAEKAFCEAVSGGYVARDKNGSLHLYEQKPKKINEAWHGFGYYTSLTTIRTLNPKINFEFITWEDNIPWSISDLLNLEVADA